MERKEKGRKEAVETNVVHSGLFDTKKKNNNNKYFYVIISHKRNECKNKTTKSYVKHKTVIQGSIILVNSN